MDQAAVSEVEVQKTSRRPHCAWSHGAVSANMKSSATQSSLNHKNPDDVWYRTMDYILNFSNAFSGTAIGAGDSSHTDGYVDCHSRLSI